MKFLHCFLILLNIIFVSAHDGLQLGFLKILEGEDNVNNMNDFAGSLNGLSYDRGINENNEVEKLVDGISSLVNALKREVTVKETYETIKTKGRKNGIKNKILNDGAVSIYDVNSGRLLGRSIHTKFENFLNRLGEKFRKPINGSAYAPYGSSYRPQQAPYVQNRLPYVQHRLPHIHRRPSYEQNRAPIEQDEASHALHRLPHAQHRPSYTQDGAPKEQDETPYTLHRLPYEQQSLPYKQHRLPYEKNEESHGQNVETREQYGAPQSPYRAPQFVHRVPYDKHNLAYAQQQQDKQREFQQKMQDKQRELQQKMQDKQRELQQKLGEMQKRIQYGINKAPRWPYRATLAQHRPSHVQMGAPQEQNGTYEPYETPYAAPRGAGNF